jgi:hypothetical protein
MAGAERARVSGRFVSDKSEADRFWAKVQKTETCWLWSGAHARYGHFYPSGGGRKSVSAHRYMWALVHGFVPEGLDVCHTCDNGLCVRPDHLFVGTHKENMADRDAKGRGGWRPYKKIPLAEHERIRARLSTGERQASIAATYSVSIAAISFLKCKFGW